MSLQFNNAIRIDVMYVEHHCNIVQFSMKVPAKIYCLSMSIIEGGVAIHLYLNIYAILFDATCFLYIKRKKCQEQYFTCISCSPRVLQSFSLKNEVNIYAV